MIYGSLLCRGLAKVGAGVAITAMSAFAFADTTAFTIVDDAALNAAVADARTAFLAERAQAQPLLTRVNVTLLVPDTNGTFKRGSFGQNDLQYPASTVKLNYMAAAMYWCRTNNKPYNFLDADVRPMIEVSDNVATGRVVDAISGVPNYAGRRGDPAYSTWYAARLYPENYLSARGLLENQTNMHKTYPTNSGSSPSGYENDAINARGGNRLNTKLPASTMLEIQRGAIEPGANAYMRGMLSHDRWGSDAVFGPALPPGTVYENKLGVAYDTLEDVAYIKLPNGQEMFLSVFSNAYADSEPSQPLPYDGYILSVFAELLIERLGYNTGLPANVKINDGGAGFSTTGAWTVGTAQIEANGTSYAYATGGSGATATYALNVPEAGTYEVAIYYPQGTNRSTAAPFTVNHNGGATVVNVNQQKTGGRWVRLGNFAFNAGGGSVVLGTAGVSSTQIVVADAVRAAKFPTLPAATSLSAVAAGSGQINLSWFDNATWEDKYIVSRSLSSSGPFTDIATLGANFTSYASTGLSASTTYFYKVRPASSGVAGADSNTASATTQAGATAPAAPSNLTATAISRSQINLTWTDNASNETNHVIERRAGSTGQYSVVATLGANVTSFSNTGLVKNTTYTYRVKATNATGSSAWSNEASAQTPQN